MDEPHVRPFTLADADAQQEAPAAPTAQEWPEEPTPLDDGQTLCDFPEDWGPAPLKDYAAALAVSTQTPPCLNIAAVLAVTAIAVQGKFRVQAGPDYDEPLNLYIALVAPAGERKSAVIRSATRFLRAYEAEEMHRPEKGFERLLCDDLAPDDLVAALARNGGRIGLVSTEGGVFSSIRRYRDGGTAILNIYSQTYDGTPARTERRGGGEVNAINPCLTMLLEAQPVLPESFIRGRNLKARDFAAHVLYAAVDASNSLVGHRMASAPPIPKQTTDAYEGALRRMLDYRPVGAQILTLSDEAEAIRADFFSCLEPRLTGPLSTMIEWASKLPGVIYRIAGVLHCFTEEEPAERPISGATMERAAALGSCLLQHAQALYGAAGGDQAAESARYILQKVAGLQQITRRDLFRACRSRFKSAKAMEPAIRLLCEHGYLREVTKQPQGGHRPSVILEINSKMQSAQ